MKLDNEYDSQSFIKYLNSFFPSFQLEESIVNLDTSSSFIEVIKIGKSIDLDLDVYEITHDLSNNNLTKLTVDAFKLIKNLASFDCLVVFKNNLNSDWKLSMMSFNYVLDSEGNINTTYSNPKRYSFALGPNAKINTPYKYLIELGKFNSLEELNERFSISVVNNEFYKSISGQFKALFENNLNKKRMLKLPNSNLDHNQLQNFAVRLIGRIIFCWFLKQKKSANGIPLLKDEIFSSSAVSQFNNFYNEVVEPLFFEILNKHTESRSFSSEHFEYDYIPFLNGGLFTPDKYDFYNKRNSEKVNISNQWFEELFLILESYNFTIDENTGINIDLSVDPEMLGRVFENLLAEINPDGGSSEREKTGSYYTPREIVEYMVDEALLNFLIEKTQIDPNKLSSLISYSLDDDLLFPLSQEEKKKVIESLVNIKIFDPACGSGAFPIGILQKLIHIFNIADENGEIWLDLNLNSLDNELRKNIKNNFDNKNINYLRKLSIIKNSIYGSDIQPVATEISRLRCFLTLIVDEELDDKKQNRGVEPLPNLDFKFVTANTLLALKNTEKLQTNQQELFDDVDSIGELKVLREEFFTSSGPDKESLKLEFVNLQRNMLENMLDKGFQGHGELTTKLSTWEPFTNKPTNWFDSEWMFGIKEGFDILLANPPYLDSHTMVKNDPEGRELIKNEYESTKGTWDLYIPFIELALRILNKDGFASYITPYQWLSISYGKALRKLLNNKIISFGNLNKVNVFEAGNSPLVFHFSRNERELVTINTFERNYTLFSLTSIPSKSLGDNWGIALTPNLKLIQKISDQKSNFIDKFSFYNPAAVNEAYELKELIKDLPDPNRYNLKDYFKLVNTGTINKYNNLWGKKETLYLKSKHLFPVVDKKLYETNYPRRFPFINRPKLIFKGKRYFDGFLDLNSSFLPGITTLVIHSIEDDINDLKLGLALFNSDVIHFYIKEAFGTLGVGGGINLTKDLAKSLPLPNIDNSIKNKILELFDEIQNQNNIEKNIELINKIIFDLFALRKDEISLIKETTKRKS
jgi:adenine-specific DNA-methyltransferase